MQKGESGLLVVLTMRWFLVGLGRQRPERNKRDRDCSLRESLVFKTQHQLWRRKETYADSELHYGTKREGMQGNTIPTIEHSEKHRA